MNAEQLHIVYTSRLAPGQDCTVYGQVCASARRRNAERGTCGVLLFDGERFLQWIYGPPDETEWLMSAIAADRRHTDVQVLLHVRLAGDAIDRTWRTGFVDADALDAFMALDPTDSHALLDGLADLVSHADLDPVPPAFPRVVR